MIHRYLKDEAAKAIPGLGWSINFYSGTDNTGTVYTEGGPPGETNDVKTRTPEYMVYIRSSDWDAAETYAQQVYDLFHERKQFVITEKGRTFIVYFIEALSEPIRLGVADNNIMEYSINFRATLREVF
ncbi:hypothetical protein BKM15_25950 [Pseudomonas syringae pv. syringae]|nr:hypothetical protein BKM15_25950 [Pseudomonas syringae pv. syringae]